MTEKITTWKIYKTTCLVNGKVYIGQTIRDGNKYKWYKGSGKSLKMAFEKYKKKEFVKETLIIVYTQEDADAYEEVYIEMYSSTFRKIGYNMLPCAVDFKYFSPSKLPHARAIISKTHKGKKESLETIRKKSIASTGRKHSDESKKKISIAKTGRKWTEGQRIKMAIYSNSGNHHMIGRKVSKETAKKISEAISGEKNYMYGKYHSPEVAEKIRQSHLGAKNHMYGKKHSQESKDKVSKTKTGIKLTEEHIKLISGSNNHGSRKVECYNRNTGETIMKFDTIREACKWCGSCCVYGNLKGKKKSAGGHVWRYSCAK